MIAALFVVVVCCSDDCSPLRDEFDTNMKLAHGESREKASL